MYSKITIFFLLTFGWIGLFAQETTQEPTLVKAVKYYVFSDFSKDFHNSVSTKDSSDFYAEFSHRSDREWEIEGEYKEFYKDGSNKKVGNYLEGNPIGLFIQWYQNGQKKEEIDYDYDKKAMQSDSKLLNYWEPDGKQLVADGNGYYLNKYENGQTEWEGNYVSGEKNGVWKKYNKEAILRHREEWKAGNAKGYTFLNEVEKAEYGVDSLYYREIEKSAEFKGGLTGFYRYISNNLKYPKKAKRWGVEGKIIVSFIVDKDGSIENVTILRGIGAGCDEETIDTVERSPKWMPGQQRGLNVRQKVALPVIFKLN